MSAVRELFVTRLYEASLASDRDWPGFRDELEDACLMLAEEDKAGRGWCKANGYGGYTSYASLDDLPQRATVFRTELLKRRLDKHAASFAKSLDLDLKGGRLRLDSLWANVLKPGAAHSGHIHPHSVISGTIYVATPPGAGFPAAGGSAPAADDGRAAAGGEFRHPDAGGRNGVPVGKLAAPRGADRGR